MTKHDIRNRMITHMYSIDRYLPFNGKPNYDDVKRYQGRASGIIY